MEMNARQPTVDVTVWISAVTVWNSAEPSTAADMFRNSLIKTEDETGDEEQHNYDHGHDMITMNRTRKKMTRCMIAI